MRSTPLASLTAALVFSVSFSASATPINGSIDFSDGFNTTATDTSIVSQLTFMDVNGNADANGCTDVFGVGCSSNGDYALAFDITLSGGQLVFDYNGFHFTADTFSVPDRTALSCDNRGDCSDAISFVASGQVTGAGFDATPFSMLWSAQATCTQNVILSPMIHCGPESISAHWQATVFAGDAIPKGDVSLAAVPEPSTLALIGAGLLLVVGVTRKRV